MRRALVAALLGLSVLPAGAQEAGPLVIAAHLSPVIPADGNTVAHVFWRDGVGLVDARGNVWAMNGTVPQVARIASAPAAAGPFSDANYYSLGTGSDVLDFSGDFSVCFVLRPTAADFTRAGVGAFPISNGTFNVDGWFVQWENGPRLRITANSPAPISAITANNAVAGEVSVGCVGKAGAVLMAKLNLGTIATAGGATIAPATTTSAKLGRYSSANFFVDGNEHEAWFSTTTPSDALFTAIMQAVKTRLGITAW